MTSQEKPQNQLIWTHTGPQRLNGQPGSLHRSDLDHLRIYYGCIPLCSCGTPKRESWSSFASFCDLFSPTGLLLYAGLCHLFTVTCNAMFGWYP